jgi:hypothetical protein
LRSSRQWEEREGEDRKVGRRKGRGIRWKKIRKKKLE